MRSRFLLILLISMAGRLGAQDERHNTKPEIVGQRDIATYEETNVAIRLVDLVVHDPDNWWYPFGFTLEVFEGDHYSVSQNTVTPEKDFHGTLSVPVRVNDGQADSKKYDLKVEVYPVNDRPVITGQEPISTEENIPVAILLTALKVTDPDNDYPSGFSLLILPPNNSNYTVSGNQVVPAQGFVGDLAVPVVVSDGRDFSDPFTLTIPVFPGNDPPEITGQSSLSTTEDEPVHIRFDDLIVEDSDNAYPNDFTLKLLPGSNYTADKDLVVPAENFSGELVVNVVVNDGHRDSNTFPFRLQVLPVNDAPVVDHIELEPLDFEPGDEPTRITEAAVIIDGDNDSIVSAEIGFRKEHYQPGSDELQFENSGGPITGQFDLRSGVLKLQGKASAAAYTQAIRSVRYYFVEAFGPKFEGKPVFISVNDGKVSSEAVPRIIGEGTLFVELDIPTAFTPNGDHANDTWEIRTMRDGDAISGAVVIRVYNRSGYLLFETSGLERSWDGKLDGEVLPADTYFYTIEFMRGYRPKSLRGIVALLR